MKNRIKRYRLKREAKKKLKSLLVLFSVVIMIVVSVSVLWPKRTYATEGVFLESAFDLEVIHQIIPEGHQNRPGIKREIHYLVVHETDNFVSSADAKNHADYLCTNTTDINSWHYTVDEDRIFHHLPDEEVGWHAGDKQTEGGGNMTGVGIELCVNQGSDFEKTLDNAAKLIAVLMDAYDLRIEEVKKHQDFSGKNCPSHLLDEENWTEFLNLIESYADKH